MQLKVAGGLAAQTLSISQNLVSTWHGAPSQVNQKLRTGLLKQPPKKQVNFATFPKDTRYQDPDTTQSEANSSPSYQY